MPRRSNAGQRRRDPPNLVTNFWFGTLAAEQPAEDGTQLLRQLGPLESVGDRRLDEADPLARIVARPLELEPVERHAARERLQAVGELDLAAFARRRVL